MAQVLAPSLIYGRKGIGKQADSVVPLLARMVNRNQNKTVWISEPSLALVARLAKRSSGTARFPMAHRNRTAQQRLKEQEYDLVTAVE